MGYYRGQVVWNNDTTWIISTPQGLHYWAYKNSSKSRAQKREKESRNKDLTLCSISVTAGRFCEDGAESTKKEIDIIWPAPLLRELY